jgi:hypothetical protein
MRFPAPLVTAFLASLIVSASSAQAQPAAAPAAPGAAGYGCPGMYGVATGPGMMGGGPWMMGHHGMMMYGPGAAARPSASAGALNLSVDDVRRNMTDWLARMGNPHLKVGQVAQAGPDTISAEVVTADKGGLVQRYVVDRRTGQFRPG